MGRRNPDVTKGQCRRQWTLSSRTGTRVMEEKFGFPLRRTAVDPMLSKFIRAQRGIPTHFRHFRADRASSLHWECELRARCSKTCSQDPCWNVRSSISISLNSLASKISRHSRHSTNSASSSRATICTRGCVQDFSMGELESGLGLLVGEGAALAAGRCGSELIVSCVATRDDLFTTDQTGQASRADCRSF